MCSVSIIPRICKATVVGVGGWVEVLQAVYYQSPFLTANTLVLMPAERLMNSGEGLPAPDKSRDKHTGRVAQVLEGTFKVSQPFRYNSTPQQNVMQQSDSKSFLQQVGKSVAPIPVPSSAPVSVVRTAPISTSNIPNILSSAVAPSSLPLTVTLTSQPNVVQLQNTTVISNPPAAGIPLNLRGTTPVQVAAPAMSQQHPSSFPPHLPRGAVAASQLTLQKNPTTAVLRAGPSPAIQIPAAPSVPSVSVSVPGLPALGRAPVISAIRPTTPPTTRSPSPAVGVPDHTRTNLIVHGTAQQGAGGATISGQPLQITLTQRVNPAGQGVTMTTEGLKPGALTALGAKPVHVPPPQQHQILQHPKVAAAGPQPTGGVGVSPQQLQQQQQAVLAASKPGALAVSAAVPAISISSMPAPLPTATVMAPASVAPSTNIPIAKVTPQRQQTPLATGLPGPIAVQTVTSGSEYATLPDLGAMTSQAGASQLLLSQTHRGQAGTMGVSTGVATLSSSMPTVATSLAPQHTDRSLPQNLFNLTATGPPQQDSMWLHQFLYQAQAAQLVSTPNPTPIVRPATNTFFVPRASTDQSKCNNESDSKPRGLTLTPPEPSPTHSVVQHAHNGGGQSAAASPPERSYWNFSRSGFFIGGQHGHGSRQRRSASGSSAASALSPGLGLASMANLASRATVASSIIAAASAHQVQSAGTVQPQQPPGTPGSVSSSNPSSSPRPSILRKRTIDGTMVMPKRPNFNLMPESHSPRPDTTPLSNISSPKTPATENSQSSTDTALSSNDATTPTQNSHPDVKVKTEPMEGLENGPSAASPAVSLSGSIVDASPRKRARKQLLNASEELKDNTSTDDEMEPDTTVKEESPDTPLPRRDEYVDEEGVRWTTERTKPTMSIIGDYSATWKPRYNHFMRYTDVKPKDDRRPTVNELANQRGIMQKSSGWKLFHVAAQLEDLIENETVMQEKIAKLKETLAARGGSRPTSDQDYSVLQELTQANLQRCQLINDQLSEAKNSMLAILNHRPKIQEIIHKNLSKRPIKKKERT
ncbi:hypothetical protein BaRGS_00024343 [Batillaria attramentaria]|uniref:Histone deacetylase complex subunit SAP130 C-terminal domain-containing protein n=1 Tax=Batillaria attramentaria TaxID=370345 RepID=A0ABD0KBH0_9CAEN